MKIVFCDNRLGGLLGFRSDIIKHYIQSGAEVTIIAPIPKTEWDKVGKKIEGCKIIAIEMDGYNKNPINDIKLLIAYYKIYRNLKPDIVFNYTIKPNIYSSIAAKMCGAKVVCMMAGLGYVFFGKNIVQRIGKILYKLGLRCADRVLLLNDMNLHHVIEHDIIPKRKAVLLKGGEGLNLNEYRYIPPTFSEPCRFLMVARVMYDKGYHEFVEAAKVVKRSHPDVIFELLGPIDNGPTMVHEDIIHHDEAEGSIQYLGVTNDIVSVIGRDSVVMILPSTYGEGLNRSLMEGCSIGRPIITTDIPGCRETVVEGKNGYLVEPKSVQSLVYKIELFLDLSNKEKAAMGEYSRKIAEERFDVKDVINEYDKLVKRE